MCYNIYCNTIKNILVMLIYKCSYRGFMCGIYGYVGQGSAAPILLEGIKKLEYRGYDSVGMATASEKGFLVKKDIGSVSEVDKKVNFSELPGTMGIVHTRW